MGGAYNKLVVNRKHRCVLLVISLRFCYILLLDKIRFAASALSYDFELKQKCEKVCYFLIVEFKLDYYYYLFPQTMI